MIIFGGIEGRDISNLCFKIWKVYSVICLDNKLEDAACEPKVTRWGHCGVNSVPPVVMTE